MYLSNDALIFDAIWNSRGSRGLRRDYSTAMHFNGLVVTFSNNYQPQWAFKPGHWTDQLNADSRPYKKIINTLYFESWHTMQSMHLSSQGSITRAAPDGAKSVGLSYLADYQENYGNKYYGTVLTKAVLATDFFEDAMEMPPYQAPYFGVH